MESISAAHPTLPMPSYVRVTNLANAQSLIVRVNDRGPYHGNREIDVSVKAAQLLDFHKNGIARVRVEYVGRAPLEGSDDRKLVATLREGAPAPAPSSVMVASARPFLPRLADTPLPAERPFDLGQPGAGATSATRGATRLPRHRCPGSPMPTCDRPARRPARPAAYLAPARAAAPGAPSLGYAAPADYVGPAAVTSGRGLY